MRLDDLSDDAAMIVSQQIDESVLIDARNVSFTFARTVDFYIHMRLEGNEDAYAALQVRVDLEDYLSSLDVRQALTDRAYS